MNIEYIRRLEDELDYYKEQLKSNKHFNMFSEMLDIKELQKKNITINDKYFRKKIKYIKSELNRLRKK